MDMAAARGHQHLESLVTGKIHEHARVVRDRENSDYALARLVDAAAGEVDRAVRRVTDDDGAVAHVDAAARGVDHALAGDQTTIDFHWYIQRGGFEPQSHQRQVLRAAVDPPPPAPLRRRDGTR